MSIRLVFFLSLWGTWMQATPLQGKDLFDSEEPLEISLKGNISALFKDLKGKPEYHPFLLCSQPTTGQPEEIEVKVRTRGHFRREMGICSYPPLLLNFPNKGKNPGVFQGYDKLKLVMPCKGERFVLREYYVYKAFQILNPAGLKVRLVRLSLLDTAGKKQKTETLWGFLLEEEDALTARTGDLLVERDLIRPHQTSLDPFLLMAMFQLMIGNTDWSIEYRQNIYLLRKTESDKPVPMPYDFDHAGLVNAPYAKPAPELEMGTVTERRYRGFCIEDMEEYTSTLGKFRAQKNSLYSLYRDSRVLEEKDIKYSIQYLDEFFSLIDQPKKLHTMLSYPCVPGSTGKVIIKGLKQ